MKKALGKNWLGAGVSLLLAIAVLAVPAAWAAEPVFSGGAPNARETAAEVCKGCHEPYVESYLASKHGEKGNSRGPDCQTCHVNALEHAKVGGGRGAGGILGFNNKAIPAAKKAAVCLSCHDGNRNLAFWDAGKHKQNDVSCNNCHALHGKPSGGSTVALRQGGPAISVFTSTERQLEYQTCAICHKDKLAQFNKPSHHPLIEGKIKCSDCHNPHGAMSLAMIKFEVTNDLCLSCHVDKRGPWINEHPPVAENCAICHTPHGSNHLKLLSLNPPQLCEECHRFGSTSSGGHPATLATGQPMTSPQAATSTTMRFMARGCVNCHRFIHGSNSAGTTGLQGRAFVR